MSKKITGNYLKSVNLDVSIGYHIPNQPYLWFSRLNDFSEPENQINKILRIYILPKSSRQNLETSKKVNLTITELADFEIFFLFQSKEKFSKKQESIYLNCFFGIEFSEKLSEKIQTFFLKKDKFNSQLRINGEFIPHPLFTDEISFFTSLKAFFSTSEDVSQIKLENRMRRIYSNFLISEEDEKIIRETITLPKGNCEINYQSVIQTVWFLQNSLADPNFRFVISNSKTNSNNYFDLITSYLFLNLEDDDFLISYEFDSETDYEFQSSFLEPDFDLLRKFSVDPEVQFISHILTIEFQQENSSKPSYSVFILFDRKNKTTEIFFPEKYLFYQNIVKTFVKRYISYFLCLPDSVHKWKYISIGYEDSEVKKMKSDCSVEIFDQFYFIIQIIIDRMKSPNFFYQKDETIKIENIQKLKNKIQTEVLSKTKSQDLFELISELFEKVYEKNKTYSTNPVDISLYKYAITRNQEIVEVGTPVCYFVAYDNVMFYKLFKKKSSDLLFPFGLPKELITDEMKTFDEYVDYIERETERQIKRLKYLETMELRKQISIKKYVLQYINFAIISRVIFDSIDSVFRICFPESLELEYDNVLHNLRLDNYTIKHFLLDSQNIFSEYSSKDISFDSTLKMLLNFTKDFVSVTNLVVSYAIDMIYFKLTTTDILEKVFSAIKSGGIAAYDFFRDILKTLGMIIWDSGFLQTIGNFFKDLGLRIADFFIYFYENIANTKSNVFIITIQVSICLHLLGSLKLYSTMKKKDKKEKKTLNEKNKPKILFNPKEIEYMVEKIRESKETTITTNDTGVFRLVKASYLLYNSNLIIPHTEVENFLTKIKQQGKQYLCSNFYQTKFLELRI